jgi:hypothetical protein
MAARSRNKAAAPDWSRPLAKPIDVGGRRKLRTLHDVRAALLNVSRHELASFARRRNR